MKPETEHIVKWSGYDVNVKQLTTFSTQHRPLHYYEIAHLGNNPESYRFINQIRNDKDAWLSKYSKEEQEFIRDKLNKESVSKLARYIRPCPHMKCKQHKGDELLETYKREKLKSLSSSLALECNIEEQKLLKHQKKITQLRKTQFQLTNKLEELDNYKGKVMSDKEIQLYRESLYFQEKIKKAKDLFASLVDEYSEHHPQQSFSLTGSRMLNDTKFDITCNNANKDNDTKEMTRIIEKINFVPRLNLLDIKLQETSKPIGLPGTFLYKSPRKSPRNQYKDLVYGCSPGREDLPYVPKRNHTGVYEFDDSGKKRWSCCLNTDIISDGCNDVTIIQTFKGNNKKDNDHHHKQHRDGSTCHDLESLHRSMDKEIKQLNLPDKSVSHSLDFYPRTKNITPSEWSSTLRTYSRQVDHILYLDTSTSQNEMMLGSQSARDSYHLSTVSEKFDNDMSLCSSNTKAPLPSFKTSSHGGVPLEPSTIKPSNFNSPRQDMINNNMKQSLQFMKKT